jgi:hypothetical protein
MKRALRIARWIYLAGMIPMAAPLVYSHYKSGPYWFPSSGFERLAAIVSLAAMELILILLWPVLAVLNGFGLIDIDLE